MEYLVFGVVALIAAFAALTWELWMGRTGSLPFVLGMFTAAAVVALGFILNGLGRADLGGALRLVGQVSLIAVALWRHARTAQEVPSPLKPPRPAAEGRWWRPRWALLIFAGAVLGGVTARLLRGGTLGLSELFWLSAPLCLGVLMWAGGVLRRERL